MADRWAESLAVNWVGSPDGTPEINGWFDASRDRLADTLGNWEGIIVGTSLLLGLVLSWLDG